MRATIIGLLAIAAPASAQCTPEWTQVMAGGPDGPVSVLLTFDDGSGAALYAGGHFSGTALASPNIARFRAGAWEGLGGGRPGEVLDLCVHDEGLGPRLHSAGQSGSFPGSPMSRWDGGSWSWVEAPGGWNGAATSFDPGTGAELFTSGGFLVPGSLPFAGYIAHRVGGEWTAVGGGADTIAWDFIEHDDGRGRALFVIGDFNTVGMVAGSGIARWDGRVWSTLGSGLQTNGFIGRVLAVFDDGSGPALYAGGAFTGAGGVSASRIASWDGQAWSPLGAGVNGAVNALAVFDDGHGPGLVAAGAFTSAGGQSTSRIAMWRGGVWTPLGAGIDGVVNALAVWDPDGSGPEPPMLAAGGDFSTAGGLPSAFVAAYRGCGCYANCDGSTAAPMLNVADFSCFLQRFAAGDPLANCDGSTAAPVLNVADFGCFLQRFAAGCP